MLHACSRSDFERLRGVGGLTTPTHTALLPAPVLSPSGLAHLHPFYQGQLGQLTGSHTSESALLSASRGEGAEGTHHHHFTVEGWQDQVCLAPSSELSPPLPASTHLTWAGITELSRCGVRPALPSEGQDSSPELMTLWAAFSTAGGGEGQGYASPLCHPTADKSPISSLFIMPKLLHFSLSHLTSTYSYLWLPCPVCAFPASRRLAMWLVGPWVTSSIHAAEVVSSGCLCPPVPFTGGQVLSVFFLCCTVWTWHDLIFMSPKHRMAIKPGCTEDYQLLCPCWYKTTTTTKVSVFFAHHKVCVCVILLCFQTGFHFAV